jgi:hypothetical protein
LVNQWKKFSVSVECPLNFQGHQITINYFHCLKLKIHTHCSTYSSSPVPSETTPLLHPSSPSLLICKENIGQPYQVSKQPIVQQG